MAASEAQGRFDPDQAAQETLAKFNDFVKDYEFVYEAKHAHRVPATLETDDERNQWFEQDRRRQFLGLYVTPRFREDYEAVVPETERAKCTFSNLKEKIRDLYRPSANKTIVNYEFRLLRQKPEQSLSSFILEVSRAAERADFKCNNEGCTVPTVMIRDQIIFGTNNEEFRKKALQEKWDLQNLKTNARTIEAAQAGMKRMAGLSDEEEKDLAVGPVRRNMGRYSNKYRQKATRGKSDDERTRVARELCSKCGYKNCRGSEKCPANGKRCDTCGKIGHFRKMCRKVRRMREMSPSEDDGNSTEDDISENEGRSTVSARRGKALRIQDVRLTHNKATSRYNVRVRLGGQDVFVVTDTGSEINVCSIITARRLGLRLRHTSMKIRPYGSKTMRAIGKYTGSLQFRSSVIRSTWYVINAEVEDLLCGWDAERLGIITFEGSRDAQTERVASICRLATSSVDDLGTRMIRKYPAAFAGIGKLRNYKVHFHTDPEVRPIAQPQRPVPYHLQEPFEREIREMEEQGVIEEHHGPVTWLSNPMLVPKDDNRVRVTLDARQPNKAIKDTKIPIPRAEDIRARLAGAKWFTKLDFRSAFHQLELDEESQMLTVFYAGHRLMRYNRLTMGTLPASGELNKALTPIFANCPEIHVIHDDIIIATESKRAHERVVEMAIKAIQEAGLTLNMEKCRFAKRKVRFWGCIVSDQGVSPDPEKVRALDKAGPPSNKAELRSFLSMVQAQSEFIPKLAKETEALRSLIKKNVRFKWGREQEKEFQKVKRLFREDTMLRFFDPKKKTFLFVDAHQTGLAAILAQGSTKEDAKPVAMNSRTTTKTEQRYPQIDLEGLAVDYGLRRFRNYLAGGKQNFIVTDHRPLVSIFNGNRTGSIRLDRVKLRHQDVKFTVDYQEGEKNPADYLSRNAEMLDQKSEEERQESNEMVKVIYMLHTTPFMEALGHSAIRKESKRDPVLRNAKSLLKEGDVPRKSDPAIALKSVWEELTIVEGLVFRGDKVILPEALHQTALRLAHQGAHPGEDRMLRRLRSHLWFPGMYREVKRFVQECKECALFTRKATKEPQSHLSTPDSPWNTVSLDLFGPLPDNRHVLVAQDQLSRFPVAKIVPKPNAGHVIKATEGIYQHYGYPDTHITDNGRCFTSREFEEYSRSKDIQHKATYPYHPQANPVECFMKPLGKAIKIAHHQKQPLKRAIDDAVATHRATPHPVTGVTPAEMMFRYRFRSNLPANKAPDEVVEKAIVRNADMKRKQKEWANRSGRRKESDFMVGQEVMILNTTRTSKYEPLYREEKYRVIAIDQFGVRLENDRGVLTWRHKNQVKPWPRHQGAEPDLTASNLEPSRHPDRHFDFRWEDDVDDDEPQRQIQRRNNVRDGLNDAVPQPRIHHDHAPAEPLGGDHQETEELQQELAEVQQQDGDPNRSDVRSPGADGADWSPWSGAESTPHGYERGVVGIERGDRSPGRDQQRGVGELPEGHREQFEPRSSHRQSPQQPQHVHPDDIDQRRVVNVQDALTNYWRPAHLKRHSVPNPRYQ